MVSRFADILLKEEVSVVENLVEQGDFSLLRDIIKSEQVFFYSVRNGV